ncbi:hypothetical protein [Nonomuraea basaltis]|uniref:hypothetical protein n=1 Tax=Nonomuraea basaltis TaxID=2495887 RepID=UPI00110C45E9|nr:hypothetical protein [Nonomuraea basaltis]TMR97561.1 hypothetical protein EJK15_17745 [Nonomuraea basaltis]
MPTTPVEDEETQKVRWFDLVSNIASIAATAGMLGLFWWLGLRTIFFGLSLCLLLSVVSAWLWQRWRR